MYKVLLKRIAVEFIAILLICSCSVPGVDETPTKKLTSIVRIQQPEGNTCAATCVKMIMDYYYGHSEDIYTIFQKVSNLSSQGRLVNSDNKVAQYFENNGLYSSLIRFTDLETILNYCEDNQIPAIMCIQDVKNNLLGHAVIFIQYIKDKGLIRIIDPKDGSREWVSFNELENSFIKVSPNAEVSGNGIILPSKTLIHKGEYTCLNCGKKKNVDVEILHAIQYIYCNNCFSTYYMIKYVN